MYIQEGIEAVADWWKRHPEQWQAGELLLACGATAVADLRAAVAAELDYSCSAGIAHNKASCQSASCMHTSIAASTCTLLCPPPPAPSPPSPLGPTLLTKNDEGELAVTLAA